MEDKKINSKNLKWKILLGIGLSPFVIVICIGIYSAFFGTTFFFTIYNGIDAFLGIIFLLSFIFLPVYIIGIILVIIAICKMRQNKKYGN